jgi:hypothetical protein
MPENPWTVWRFGVLAAGLLVAQPAFAQLEVRLYGDTDYRIDGAPTREVTHSFQLPILDLFATGDYDRWSFIAEVAFEFDSKNQLGVDVERGQLMYLLNDHLRISAGRSHTAFGYYNDAYHHGAYHQLSVSRPDAVQFEDKGGLIPAHAVGLHADGRFDLGAPGRLRYDLEVSNGRGATPDQVLNVSDLNLFKSVNVRVRLEPAFAEDLVIGANVLYDRLPSSPGRPDLDQLLIGAHVAYLHHPIHLIAEVFTVQDRERDTGLSHWNWAGYAEFGVALGSFEPYAAFNFIRLAPNGDPYFAPLDGFDSHASGLVGVKWTTNEHVALKLEGRYSQTSSNTQTFTAIAQAAYVF